MYGGWTARRRRGPDKKRLIEAGVVGDVGQGHYTVELPGFKEYVREALT